MERSVHLSLHIMSYLLTYTLHFPLSFFWRFLHCRSLLCKGTELQFSVHITTTSTTTTKIGGSEMKVQVSKRAKGLMYRNTAVLFLTPHAYQDKKEATSLS